jgi:hypothetical protein
VVTAAVTHPAVAAGTATAGEPGTGGAAGFGNTSGTPGTPASSYGHHAADVHRGPGDPARLRHAECLYTQLSGLGVLRAYVPGQDNAGHGALSN